MNPKLFDVSDQVRLFSTDVYCNYIQDYGCSSLKDINRIRRKAKNYIGKNVDGPNGEQYIIDCKGKFISQNTDCSKINYDCPQFEEYGCDAGKSCGLDMQFQILGKYRIFSLYKGSSSFLTKFLSAIR